MDGPRRAEKAGKRGRMRMLAMAKTPTELEAATARDSVWQFGCNGHRAAEAVARRDQIRSDIRQCERQRAFPFNSSTPTSLTLSSPLALFFSVSSVGSPVGRSRANRARDPSSLRVSQEQCTHKYSLVRSRLLSLLCIYRNVEEEIPSLSE